jgi:hypothetical protein
VSPSPCVLDFDKDAAHRALETLKQTDSEASTEQVAKPNRFEVGDIDGDGEADPAFEFPYTGTANWLRVLYFSNHGCARPAGAFFAREVSSIPHAKRVIQIELGSGPADVPSTKVRRTWNGHTWK